jgi:hypothetical protein
MSGITVDIKSRFKLALMNTPSRLLIVTALVMLTASVKAEIGETPKQMESGRPDFVSRLYEYDVVDWVVYYPKFGKKPLTHTGVFTGGVAVAESFCFNDHHPMSEQEIAIFLKPYAAFRRGGELKSSDKDIKGFELIYPGGGSYAVVTYDKTEHMLSIWRTLVWDYVSSKVRTFDDEPVRQTQQPQLPDRMKNKDCAVVATENLHRLAPTAAWSNVLVFDYMINGVRQGGHAVAVWKIAPESKVMVVDENGTLELDTTSTDANDILAALAAKYAATASGKVSIALEGHFAVNK